MELIKIDMIGRKIKFYKSKTLLVLFLILTSCANNNTHYNNKYMPINFSNDGIHRIEKEENFYSKNNCEIFIKKHLEKKVIEEKKFWKENHYYIKNFDYYYSKIKITKGNIFNGGTWSASYHCIPKTLVFKIGYWGDKSDVLNDKKLEELYPNSNSYFDESIFPFGE